MNIIRRFLKGRFKRGLQHAHEGEPEFLPTLRIKKAAQKVYVWASTKSTETGGERSQKKEPLRRPFWNDGGQSFSKLPFYTLLEC
jgi:hypothetical protein